MWLYGVIDVINIVLIDWPFIWIDVNIVLIDDDR
jgi:hypothetical protein